MKEDIIVGLDIGSSFIRVVVGQEARRDQREKLQVIGAVEVPSEGINRGGVTSIEDTTSSITACLERAERLIGVPITSAWVSINGPHIKCERSKGIVAVSKSDGEITEDDVARAVEAARAMSVPPNYEILHVIPVKFTVDNQEDIKDPVGMNGIRLEVEAIIIQGLSSHIKNLTKAIYRTGIDIEDLVLSPLVAAEAVIESKQKELGAALINIGSSTTSLAVFEEGEVLHTAVIPIGSEHITADLAIGLRCPIDLAENVKIKHGSARPDLFNKKDEIDINELYEEEQEEQYFVSRKYIAEIIEARVEEIFEKVDDEFKKIDRSGMLPAGVFLVGGGVKLSGIVEVAKEKLRLPACVGSNKTITSVIDKVDDPGFLTALGLVAWGSHIAERATGSSWSGASVVNKSISKVKDWISSLMP